MALASAAEVTALPQNGSLFENIMDQLNEQDLADEEALFNGPKRAMILDAINSTLQRRQEVGAAIGAAPEVVTETLMAALFLRARRQGPLTNNQLSIANLRAATAVLGLPVALQNPIIVAIREANEDVGMSAVQAAYHLLSARLWAIVQHGIVRNQWPAGIMPPLNGPPPPLQPQAAEVAQQQQQQPPDAAAPPMPGGPPPQQQQPAVGVLDAFVQQLGQGQEPQAPALAAVQQFAGGNPAPPLPPPPGGPLLGHALGGGGAVPQHRLLQQAE